MASIFREQMDRVTAVLRMAGEQAAALTVLPEMTAPVAEEVMGRVLPRCSEKLQRTLIGQLSAEARMTSSSGSILELMATREAVKQTIRTAEAPELAAMQAAGALSAPSKRFLDLLEDATRLFRIRVETAPSRAANDERSRNISQRVAAAELEIEKLKDRLRLMRETRATTMQTMEKQHESLKSELEEIQRSRVVNEQALAAYSQDQDLGLRTNHEIKHRELVLEQKALEQQFAKLVEENEASNLALRKRRNHAKAELSKSIAQYDTDLIEVTEKIEATKRDISRDAAQLALLVKHFAVVDTNATFKSHEEASAAKLKELKEQEFNTKFLRPIRRIQRWYKNILAARKAASKGKKKKKGGGKAGGKKKKK